MNGQTMSEREREISGEEADLLVRSTKKAKAATGDAERECTGKTQMNSNMEIVMESADGQSRIVIQEEEKKEDGGRKIISYRDRLLGINGSHNEDSESEGNNEEDNMEEEEDSNEPGREMEESNPLCPVVPVSMEERKEWCKPWKNSLIVNLLGKSIGFKYLKARLEKIWNPMGNLQLIDIGNGFYVARFSELKDYNHALQDGPWLIAEHYLMVQRWRPEFDPFLAQHRKVAVWIRIPGLHLEYYNKRFLWRVGNIIGRTLKVDMLTLREQENQTLTERGRFARVCVEIDLQKQLIPKVMIRGRVHPIQYEGLHMICFHCGRFGHRKETCPEATPKENHSECANEMTELNGKRGSDEKQNALPRGNEGGKGKPITDDFVEIGEEDFGGWMIPQRRTQQNRTRNAKIEPDKTRGIQDNLNNKGSRYSILTEDGRVLNQGKYQEREAGQETYDKPNEVRLGPKGSRNDNVRYVSKADGKKVMPGTTRTELNRSLEKGGGGRKMKVQIARSSQEANRKTENGQASSSKHRENKEPSNTDSQETRNTVVPETQMLEEYHQPRPPNSSEAVQIMKLYSSNMSKEDLENLMGLHWGNFNLC